MPVPTCEIHNKNGWLGNNLTLSYKVSLDGSKGFQLLKWNLNQLQLIAKK